MQLGPTLALFVRSVREDNRAKFSYIARLLLVVIVLFFLYTAYNAFSRSIGSPGLEFFRVLTIINAVFITLAGIAFFSTAISEEKEEGTLGLLRMTKLNPVSILLGKSTSRLFGATMLILSQVPFTLLAVSLGGVTQSQVFAVYASLLAWVFFLSNLALLCSVVRSRNTGATTLTALSLILLYIIPPIVGWVLYLLKSEGVISPTGLLSNTFGAIGVVLAKCEFVRQIIRILAATGYSGTIFSFQVGACLVGGAALFGLSWAFFNTFNREQKEAAPGRGILGSIRSPDSPKNGAAATTSRLFSPRRPRGSAVFWKDFHFSRGGWVGMFVRISFTALTVGIIMLLTNPRGGFDENEVGWFLIIVGLLTGALDTALGAGRIFAGESKWNTLSSLVILPMTVGSIAYQKIAALLLSTLPYWLIVFVGLLLIGTVDFHDFVGGIFHPASIYLIVNYLLCLHLTVIFSLIVKGGALVAVIIAVSLIAVGNFIIGIVLSAGRVGDSGVFIFLSLCACGLCAFLQFTIGQRLEKLAAEE